MDNRNVIQKSIDYIEQNLKAEITAKELADAAGFSVFHYYRIFQSVVGMPVMQYILRRRILNALYDIGHGNECDSSMTDVALCYGFDTYAGFYKACVREIGYTPSDFLKRHKTKKSYKRDLFKEEHIMITRKKINELLKYWGLQEESVKDIYYEGTGNHNDSAYYVGEHYVLKFAAEYDRIRKQIELSKALEGAGIVAATAVPTKDGREVVEDEGVYYCVTRRLEGKSLTADDLFDTAGTAKSHNLGKLIGNLHLALKEMDVVVDDANLYESVIGWAMPKVRQMMNLSNQICKDYAENFGAIYDKLPKQIIHRDPNPGNIIANDNSCGFIDFELSERNVRIFDPCYAATAVLSECFANDNDRLSKWIEIYQGIIRGYDSVAKLSDEEKKAIPYVILSNQLICIAWFSEMEKFEEICKTNMKMTKWIIEHMEELQIR